MIEPFDTFEHAGLLVELHYDDDCSSPQDNDNAGTIYSWTRDFDGDEQIREPSLEIECPDCEDGEVANPDSAAGDGRSLCSRCEGQAWITVGLPEFMLHDVDAVLTLPMRFSDYGSNGARIHLGADDPNCCICFTEEELTREWGGSVDDAAKYATARIAELDSYLQGECYGYIVKNADGTDIALPDAIESVWGFIDPNVWKDDSYVRQEARSSAEYVRSLLDAEEAERLAWAARDVETVG